MEKYRKKERMARSIWEGGEFRTEDGTNAVKAVFSGQSPFEYPKSPNLIKQCLQMVGSGATLVLDSFAGSGTTAEAVLRLNKEDGGKRRFILVEMENYADSITAERGEAGDERCANCKRSSFKSWFGRHLHLLHPW